jgi:hypothetical protein
MRFKRRTVMQLADMICGNFPQEESFFVYRTSSQLTEFFWDIDTDYAHDGSTRQYWVADCLEEILSEPQPGTNTPSDTFARVIASLMDPADAMNEDNRRDGALEQLNAALAREDFEAFYAPDKKCYLKHMPTKTVFAPAPNPHRAFSAAEIAKREQLQEYLGKCSEDELIEEILLPLFRQLGFQRITAAGHKEKPLEYGKVVWISYTLPTQHILYFGIQAKKGKLDSSGMSKAGNTNVAEILNQALMMVDHEIFDPEANRRVLVDHAFIIAGGEITKQARAWIGNKLHASKRSQIMFMDRDDILNLFAVTNLRLPSSATQVTPDQTEGFQF